jgi:hypothetical protein
MGTIRIFPAGNISGAEPVLLEEEAEPEALAPDPPLAPLDLIPALKETAVAVISVSVVP